MGGRMNKFLGHLAGGNEKKKERLTSFYRDLCKMRVKGIKLTVPNTQGMKNLLRYAAEGKPLNIISTVCPDYSTNRHGIYTFEGLGEGVGFLPRLHLKIAKVLLPLLARYQIGFEHSLLIADLVEGTDPVVVAKFCDGDINEFLRRCESTRRALAVEIRKTFPDGIAKHVHAGTFSTFYGEDYLRAQGEFARRISQWQEQDPRFRQTFALTHADRLDLYRKFLQGYIDSPTSEQLEYRTARGIAMYATHFTLLRLNVPQAVVINHRTMNLQFANRSDLTRSGAERRKVENKPRVPIFIIENRVY